MITSVKITVGGIDATTDGETWSCKEEWMRQVLELRAGFFEIVDYTPSPAYSMAMFARDRLGAKIEDVIETGDDEPEGAVY